MSGKFTYSSLRQKAGITNDVTHKSISYYLYLTKQIVKLLLDLERITTPRAPRSSTGVTSRKGDGWPRVRRPG